MAAVVRVLVVDDEDLARERLVLLLQKFAERRALSGTTGPTLEIEEARDGVEAVEKIREREPDLVFLDIQMPEISGFDVLLQFPDRRFEVIFQTAYSEFALKAFEVAAADYLLKPFPPERFEQALTRALERLGENVDRPVDNSVDKSFASALVHLEHVAVRVGSRVKMIPVEEIQYFLSEDHMTQLFTKETSYACDPSLSALEERLDPRHFLRVHRNAIVNRREVASFTLETNATLTLKSGVTLKVSRERKKDLKALLGER